MKLLTTLLFLCCLSFSLAAQIGQTSSPPTRCNHDEIHQLTYQNDEDYRRQHDEKMLELEAARVSAASISRLACSAPIIIPVAVHYEGVSTQTDAIEAKLSVAEFDDSVFSVVSNIEQYFKQLSEETGIDLGIDPENSEDKIGINYKRLKPLLDKTSKRVSFSFLKVLVSSKLPNFRIAL